MRNVILALMAIFLLGVASAATQNVEIWSYIPDDDFGGPRILLTNSQDSDAQIKNLEIKLYSNVSTEVIKVKEIVTVPVEDWEGYDGWVPVQLASKSQDFLKKGRWNVTRIEISGYLYGDSENPETSDQYRALEMIDAWNIDPEAMRNVTEKNNTIVNGGVYDPPKADYLI